MKKAIIFDFNRTLFDPDEKVLLPGVKTVLTDALFKGYMLFLVSTGKASGIEQIEASGISGAFIDIIVTEKKNVPLFKRLSNQYFIDVTKSFVIGDRISGEITIGNKLGFTTIWLRDGKFKDQKPTRRSERPSLTIRNLVEVKKFIK